MPNTDKRSIIANTSRQIRHHTDFLLDLNPYRVTETHRDVYDVVYGDGYGVNTEAVALSRSGRLTFIERRMQHYESGPNIFWYEFALGSLYEESRRRNKLVKSSSIFFETGKPPQIAEEVIKRPHAKMARGHKYDPHHAQPEHLTELLLRIVESELLDEESADREREMLDLSNPYVLNEAIATPSKFARFFAHLGLITLDDSETTK